MRRDMKNDIKWKNNLIEKHIKLLLSKKRHSMKNLTPIKNKNEKKIVISLDNNIDMSNSNKSAIFIIPSETTSSGESTKMSPFSNADRIATSVAQIRRFQVDSSRISTYAMMNTSQHREYAMKLINENIDGDIYQYIDKSLNHLPYTDITNIYQFYLIEMVYRT